MDKINNPPHYTYSHIQPIDVIESWELGYCLGNVVKYVCRAGHKTDSREDLEKAIWYLKRELLKELPNTKKRPLHTCDSCGSEFLSKECPMCNNSFENKEI